MRRLFVAAVILGSAGILSTAAFGQTAPVSGQAFAPFMGTYQLPTGDIILVSRMGVTDEVARPYFLDWQTGRYGYLTAREADRFTATASAKPDAVVQTDVIFSRNSAGAVDALTITESGMPARRASRVMRYTDREVVFKNGDVTLAATLRMPPGKGQFPAIVLVHGSGPGERPQISLMNSFFAGLGLAVLTYDKRGCGGSGGDWKKVDLDVLAQDALAGVRWLKSQPGIDAKRVGVWGISQGGWITPLAGSLDEGVGFVINSSGPATSLRRQDSYNTANTLRYSGLNDDVIALVVKGLNTLYDFGQGKASADAVDEIMNQGRAYPEIKDLILPPARQITPEAMYAKQKIGDPAWFFHLNPDNDALTPYKRLTCPVLVTYGRLDFTVPVEESEKLLAAIQAESRRKNLTVAVIADSGHGYLRMQEAQPMNPIAPMSISRAYFASIETWLRANRVIAPTRQPAGNRGVH